MTDHALPTDSGFSDPLELVVGCEFECEAAQSVPAIIQVAPFGQPAVAMRREQWDAAGGHYGYLDRYPPPEEAMDFAAWFEAYLDGRWHTFDARNSTPRVGSAARRSRVFALYTRRLR